MKKQKEKEVNCFIDERKLKASEVWNEDKQFYLSLDNVKRLIKIVLEEKK